MALCLVVPVSAIIMLRYQSKEEKVQKEINKYKKVIEELKKMESTKEQKQVIQENKKQEYIPPAITKSINEKNNNTKKR